ncbi:hypothetical protein LZ32DRAFT_205062 [Colletotrichum eremochloae]|nr:hypothetical protein LZ32DRAFT_205062 [Colletotrichum eremochloae]
MPKITCNFGHTLNVRNGRAAGRVSSPSKKLTRSLASQWEQNGPAFKSTGRSTISIAPGGGGGGGGGGGRERERERKVPIEKKKQASKQNTWSRGLPVTQQVTDLHSRILSTSTPASNKRCSGEPAISGIFPRVCFLLPRAGALVTRQGQGMRKSLAVINPPVDRARSLFCFLLGRAFG